MKRYIRCSQISNDAKKDIESLVEEYIYQIYDTGLDKSLEEVTMSVLDHVLYDITEVSPESYSQDVVDLANRNNKEFVRLVTDYVNNHYDDYDWFPVD